MFCRNCGSYNGDDARVCANCGTVLAPDANVNAPAGTPGDVNPAAYPQQPQQPQNNDYNYNYNNYNTYNPNTAPVPAAPAVPGKGMAIASLVLGIVSLICFAIITGPLAIVFGCVSKSKGYRGGMATAGIICGAIGVALWAVLMIAGFSL